MKNLSSAYLPKRGRPVAQIMIGTETPWQSKGSLIIKSIDISVNVENESSVCTIVLTKPTTNFKLGTFMSGDEFKVVQQGESISVSLGYYISGKIPFTYEAFSGFISKVRIGYDRQFVTTVIECLDAKMWMMPGCKFEKKLMNKYSSIVGSTLLPAYTGKVRAAIVNIQGEPTLSKPVYQTNESDYQFLCRLAEITGCLFYIYCGVAYFISPGALKSNVGLVISPCQELEKVSWTSDVLGIPQQIVVQGIDPQKPKVPAKSTDVKVNLGNIGQGLSPSMMAKNIGSATKKEITDLKADTMAVAQFMAQAEFTRRSMEFVKCVATISGYTDLPANLSLGMGVKISGLGTGVDNSYILTGIHHRYINSKKLEFTTDLTLSSDSSAKAIVV